MGRPHWPGTVYSLAAKAGLWVALWGVRASIGDPGDGSFGYITFQWAPDASWVDVPMVNLGYLPWSFALRVESSDGAWQDPDGRTLHRAWIGPRSVRWVRMWAPKPKAPDAWVRFELCTDPRLSWLRVPECHRFRAE